MRNTPAVAERLQAVRVRIARAARAAGREPGSIALLAVSKRQSVAAIEAARAAGQRAFGENYLQEALDKMDALPDFDGEWHFIGRLQSNKTRPVAERFDWVHTVDRGKLARRLSEQRPAGLAPLNICIQVNIDDDPAKAGCAPGEAAALVAQIRDLPRLRLRGLMCIPQADRDPAPAFAALAELGRELALDTLSMGMSGDLEAAVTAGSTLLRVGTAIFGPRD